MSESDHVGNARDARSTHYGVPLTWITQDQRIYLQKPTLPTNATLGNPRRDPSDIDLGNLLLDVLIVGSVPTVTYLAVRGAIRLSKPRTRRGRATQAIT